MHSCFGSQWWVKIPVLWDTVGQGQVSPAHGSMAPKRVYDRMVDLGRSWARSLGIGDGDVAVAIIADGRERSCLKHTSSLQAWPARKCTVIMESIRLTCPDISKCHWTILRRVHPLSQAEPSDRLYSKCLDSLGRLAAWLDHYWSRNPMVGLHPF